MSNDESNRPGRPRSQASRRAVLEAARALLEERGVMGITMEGIANRAGVGKPTVYRWWPDRYAVLMEALLDADADAPQERSPTRASPRGALSQQLQAIARRLASPQGRHITSLLASADATSELAKAFRSHFLLARRTEGIGLLREAQRLGEVDPTLDAEALADALYGAVFLRLMVGHAPLTGRFLEALLEVVVPRR
jgi:AcrR family transcriptional regulator